MQIIQSAFFRISKSDVVKGVIVTVLVTVLGMFQQGVETYGLHFAAYDWAGIFDVAWKTAVAYLTKQLLTDQNGKVLGKI